MKTKLYQFYDSDGVEIGMYQVPENIDYYEVEKCFNEWYTNFPDLPFEDFASSNFGLKDIERLFIDEEITYSGIE